VNGSKDPYVIVSARPDCLVEIDDLGRRRGDLQR